MFNLVQLGMFSFQGNETLLNMTSPLSYLLSVLGLGIFVFIVKGSGFKVFSSTQPVIRRVGERQPDDRCSDYTAGFGTPRKQHRSTARCGNVS